MSYQLNSATEIYIKFLELDIRIIKLETNIVADNAHATFLI